MIDISALGAYSPARTTLPRGDIEFQTWAELTSRTVSGDGYSGRCRGSTRKDGQIVKEGLHLSTWPAWKRQVVN